VTMALAGIRDDSSQTVRCGLTPTSAGSSARLRRQSTYRHVASMRLSMASERLLRIRQYVLLRSSAPMRRSERLVFWRLEGPGAGKPPLPEVKGGAVISLTFLPAGRIAFDVKPPQH
jgi:hypothetical protein